MLGVRIPPGLFFKHTCDRVNNQNLNQGSGGGIPSVPWAWYDKAVQFFRDVRSELRKVTFPTRKETIASTVVVLIAVFAIAIYLGVVDAVLSVVIGGILR